MEKEVTDEVNHPSHYTQGDVECIDAIAAALGLAGFRDFLRGQVLKYVWRGPHKRDALQDYRKALWYLNALTETYEPGE